MSFLPPDWRIQAICNDVSVEDIHSIRLMTTMMTSDDHYIRVTIIQCRYVIRAIVGIQPTFKLMETLLIVIQPHSVIYYLETD